MDKEILIIGPGDIAGEVKDCLGEGHKIISKQGLASGLKAARGGPQIVLVDLSLPDGSGIECMKEIKSYYPETLVIIMLPEGAKKDIIAALKEGAYACIEKPVQRELLAITIASAEKYLGMRETIEKFKTTGRYEIIGKSPEMLKVMRQIERVSQKPWSVLITGEAGSGRELVARTIHFLSPRKGREFMAISAKDISARLQVATTSPQTSSHETIEGGTLLIKGLEKLDSEQVEAFRLAGEGKLCLSLGDKAMCNVRILGSAKTDPGLSWMEIRVPPLRKRREDILLIAEHFLKEAAGIFGTGTKKLSKEAEKALIDYNWPGNVRELKTVIRKACVVSKGGLIEKEDLLSEGIGSIKEFLGNKLRRYIEMSKTNNSDLYDTVISEVQKSLVELAMKESKGNQLRAAKTLGISRNTLRTKIRGL